MADFKTISASKRGGTGALWSHYAIYSTSQLLTIASVRCIQEPPLLLLLSRTSCSRRKFKSNWLSVARLPSQPRHAWCLLVASHESIFSQKNLISTSHFDHSLHTCLSFVTNKSHHFDPAVSSSNWVFLGDAHARGGTFTQTPSCRNIARETCNCHFTTQHMLRKQKL